MKKEVKPMTIERGSIAEPDLHRVVIIEYLRGPRRRWLPFNVTTVGPSGKYCDYYDFENTVNGLMWHNSGSGPGPELIASRYSKPSPPPCKIWLSPEVPIVQYKYSGTRCGTRPIRQSTLLKFGYEKIEKPLVLGATSNPFEVSDESEAGFVWCRHCHKIFCRDSYNLCQHLEWCDDCGCFVDHKGVSEDSYDGKPHSHLAPEETGG